MALWGKEIELCHFISTFSTQETHGNQWIKNNWFKKAQELIQSRIIQWNQKNKWPNLES